MNGIGSRKDTNTMLGKRREGNYFLLESCVCLMPLLSSGLAPLIAWIILASPHILSLLWTTVQYRKKEHALESSTAGSEICSSPFPMTLGMLLYLLSLSFFFGKIFTLTYKHKIVIINDACCIAPG